MIADPLALPTPSTIAVRSQQVVAQSDVANSNVLLTRVVDPQVQPTSWTLQWDNKSGAVGKTLEEHWAAFRYRAWPWFPPGAATAVRVLWRSLQLQWRGDAKCSATGEIELATTY